MKKPNLSKLTKQLKAVTAAIEKAREDVGNYCEDHEGPWQHRHAWNYVLAQLDNFDLDTLRDLRANILNNPDGSE